MPVETTSGVPSRFTASDTVRFSVENTEYPATSWTLLFAMRGRGGNLSQAGVADGDAFTVTLTSAATAAIAPGQYSASLIYTETATTEKVTVPAGTVTVDPNMALTTTGPRRAAYEAALAQLEALAAKQFASVSVEGESYNLQSIGQLTELVDRL